MFLVRTFLLLFLIFSFAQGRQTPGGGNAADDKSRYIG